MIFRSPRNRNTVSNEGVGEVVGGNREGEDEDKRKRRKGKEEEQKREEEKESFWCL